MHINQVMDHLAGNGSATAPNMNGGAATRGLTARRRPVSTRRRLEQRELRVYSAIGFIVFLPLVMAGRSIDALRGRSADHRGTVIEETNAKVGGLLGFVFMA